MFKTASHPDAPSTMSSRPAKRARKSAADSSLTASFDDITSREVLPTPVAAVSNPTFTIDNISGDRRRIYRESLPLPDNAATHALDSGTQEASSSSNTADGGPAPAADWEGSFFVADDGIEPAPDSTRSGAAGTQGLKRYTSSVSTCSRCVPLPRLTNLFTSVG